MKVSKKAILKWAVVALVVLFAGLQFARPTMSNPPVDESRTLESHARVPAEVAAVLGRSCNDCHSSRTRWPWYSQVVPVSWFLARHVEEGRRQLTFSDWGSYTPRRASRKLDEICEQVEAGEMPLKSYLLLHPSAKLSDADRKLLCEWTEAERARLAAEQSGDARP
jgi:hypothetical protein